MGDEDKKPCLKCLLAQIDPAAYERDIKRLLDAMKPGEKVKTPEYERRLDVCKGCGDTGGRGEKPLSVQKMVKTVRRKGGRVCT